MTTLKSIPFGVTKEGTPVTCYRLSSSKLEVSVLDYGATVQSVLAPDRDGNMADVVLGYDTPAEYQENPGYLGATVGRYCNRIRDARFVLNGVEYTLSANDGKNQLHGGIVGFDQKIWQRIDEKADLLTLRLTSPHGEEGFPGELTVTVRFSLCEDTLRIDYEATADRDTVANFTNHAYFNLAGHGSGAVDDQLIQIEADEYTPVDGELLPTGELAPVAGTGLDLRTPTPIGVSGPQGDGCDHNFVLKGDGFRQVAQAADPVSGRRLAVYTDLPGMQFYTANMLDPVKGKGGISYGRHGGFCLETQFYPDTPNQPGFPSCVLKAGETFRTATAYVFSVEP